MVQADLDLLPADHDYRARRPRVPTNTTLLVGNAL
jgi:hypothetical protein